MTRFVALVILTLVVAVLGATPVDAGDSDTSPPATEQVATGWPRIPDGPDQPTPAALPDTGSTLAVMMLGVALFGFGCGLVFLVGRLPEEIVDEPLRDD